MTQNLKVTSFLTFLGLLLVEQGIAQGFDAGDADPLKLGRIDPVILELGATYLFITPFVVFVMGILVIPVALVFLFLIILPLYVPTSSSEGRQLGQKPVSTFILEKFNSVLSSGDCINRIICEITSSGSGDYVDSLRSTNKNQDQSRRKVFQTSRKCSRFLCKPVEIFSSVLKRYRES